MTLDTLVRGVEARISEQSALLELAQAWMEKTSGRVTNEVTFDTRDYISLLTSLPLWNEVRTELSLYAPMLRQACLRKKNTRGEKARMLIYAPTLIHVINHVIEHDFYSEGESTSPLSHPYGLLSILRNYVSEGEGKRVRFKGEGRSVLMEMAGGYLDQETIFRTTGLQNRWDAYQSQRKIPPQVARKIKNVLEHFLEHKHYSAGNGKQGALGQPLPLRSVLHNYQAKENGKMVQSRGDCAQIYTALFQELITEDMVWKATGLEEAWSEYQKTTKLPPEMVDKINETMRTFLRNPLYSPGCAAYGPKGVPIPLNSFFRSYRVGEMRIRKNCGDLRVVWDGLVRERITPEMIWQAVPLKAEWEAYRQSTADKPYQLGTEL